MVKLEKIFCRFPQLTMNQKNEIARRRVIRGLDSIPSKAASGVDLWYALGWLGTKPLFTPFVYPRKRRSSETI